MSSVIYVTGFLGTNKDKFYILLFSPYNRVSNLQHKLRILAAKMNGDLAVCFDSSLNFLFCF